MCHGRVTGASPSLVGQVEPPRMESTQKTGASTLRLAVSGNTTSGVTTTLTAGTAHDRAVDIRPAAGRLRTAGGRAGCARDAQLAALARLPRAPRRARDTYRPRSRAVAARAGTARVGRPAFGVVARDEPAACAGR